ncbi:polyprenyl synthetase family protein [Limibacter armeniacum]|uniref:polyprenyl synthetase family protein n=1 Tax=Limibacter armeniacum TaxID=466084 RepID=UPI002FE5CE37
MSFDFKAAAVQVQEAIHNLDAGTTPAELYDPLYYILSIGGKRTRPVLTLLGCYLFDDDYLKAMQPALGVEMFHNFTLMHDDIMDKAPLRRGKATVHEKWNDNTAILSGDVMLVKAYDQFLQLPTDKLSTVLALFNKCAAEVCEGQQYDMNFETLNDVKEDAYVEMIRLKTAVLLGFSLRLGAIIGGADAHQASLLKEFGENIGTGFQIKDDILDVYADQAKFGKQVGGDIIANKKTYMLIKAMELASGETEKELTHWLSIDSFDKTEKVKAVTSIYDALGIKAIAEQKMDEYFQKGFDCLDKLNIPEEKKQYLRGFAEELYKRDK